MNDKFRSRKFGLAVACLGLSFLALGLGWVEGSSWVPLVGLILGLYGAANVGEAAVDKKNGG